MLTTIVPNAISEIFSLTPQGGTFEEFISMGAHAPGAPLVPMPMCYKIILREFHPHRIRRYTYGC